MEIDPKKLVLCIIKKKFKFLKIPPISKVETNNSISPLTNTIGKIKPFTDAASNFIDYVAVQNEMNRNDKFRKIVNNVGGIEVVLKVLNK